MRRSLNRKVAGDGPKQIAGDGADEHEAVDVGHQAVDDRSDEVDRATSSARVDASKYCISPPQLIRRLPQSRVRVRKQLRVNDRCRRDPAVLG